MDKIKLQRYESIILNSINKTIVFDVNNKYAKFGRVTYVKLSNDLSIVKAYIECLDHNYSSKTIDALNKLSGLFRSKLSTILDTYKVPKVIFEMDKSIIYAENIDKIIKDINSKK